MSNRFLNQPHFDTPLENPPIWVCPKTGLKVPMQQDENLKWREKLLKDADKDPIFQRELLAACKQSVKFWINTFCFSYHQFETDPNTGGRIPAIQADHPFILWPTQNQLIDVLEESFEHGKDLLIDKTREMGASWQCLTYLHWLWLFRPKTEIREMSRKEDLVDDPSMDSLMAKHDYINKWLPEWMRPPGVMVRGRDHRTNLRIYNELNESTISGESTNKVSLSGGRAAILFLDEFAKVENGTAIRSSTTDVAPCRIVNSTVFGAGTEYSRWKKSGQIKVFPLMFWNHPQKGKGRYIIQDEITGEYQIRSPWLDKQSDFRSQKEIAQEILAEDLEAGATFFSTNVIDKHISLFACEPVCKLNVDFKDSISNDTICNVIRRKDLNTITYRKTGNGKLSIWVELINGRLDQSKTYILGIDTSKGQGASESVISIKCKQTKEKVGEWTDRNTPPYEFARIVVAVALWTGGAMPHGLPFLKWEMNGPGWDLGRLLVKTFCYPHYYRNEKPGLVKIKITDKYGWHTGRDTKKELLGAYDTALATGNYINHSKRGLEQAKYYIYYPNGGIGPADLSDIPEIEKKLHGDIVIADALTVDDKEIGYVKHKKSEAPYWSIGFRMKRALDKKKPLKGWKQPYDFTKATV